MFNLQKSVKTSYQPGSAGVPASAGQPALPARYVTESVYSCEYEIDKTGWISTYVPPNPLIPGSQGSYILVPPAGYNGVGYGYVCRDRLVTRYVAAQPYIPPSAAIAPIASQTIIDRLLGWNARGYSKQNFPLYGEVRFKVHRSAVGVIAGLNTVPAASGYADIKFAFYLASGVARIMQSGVGVLNIGEYADGDVFKIRRLRGMIYYFINDTQVYSTSNDEAPMFLDAAMYSGGDSVDEPVVDAWSGSDGVLLPFEGISGNVANNGAKTSMLAFTGSSGSGTGAATAMAPMTGLSSDYDYSESRGIMSALTGYAENLALEPEMSSSSAVVLLFSGISSGLTGEVGGSNGELKPLIGLSSNYSYAESRGSLLPFTGVSSGIEGPNEATIFSEQRIAGTFTTAADLFVVMNSHGVVTSVFAASITVQADMLSVGNEISTYSLQSIMNALMYSTINGKSVTPSDAEPREVWVVNAETTGSSRYENFAFNSFAKIGANYYGVKSDGLYQLDGDDDDGSPIQAMMSFGVSDFGAQNLHRVTHCYLGMSSSGKMFLKVLFEGQSYLYEARSSSSNMKVQRIDTGQGIRTNYLEFELYNKDGDDFELDTVTFEIVALKRRI